LEEQYYLNRRDELINIRESSFEFFDKNVLQLSVGILALSLTFLDKIGRPDTICTLILISASWLSFIGVITSTLCSFYFAEKNMDKKLKELDDNYKNGNDKDSCFVWKHLTNFCNRLSLSLFIIGLVFFVLYGITINSSFSKKGGPKNVSRKQTNRKYFFSSVWQN